MNNLFNISNKQSDRFYEQKLKIKHFYYSHLKSFAIFEYLFKTRYNFRLLFNNKNYIDKNHSLHLINSTEKLNVTKDSSFYFDSNIFKMIINVGTNKKVRYTEKTYNKILKTINEIELFKHQHLTLNPYYYNRLENKYIYEEIKHNFLNSLNEYVTLVNLDIDCETTQENVYRFNNYLLSLNVRPLFIIRNSVTKHLNVIIETSANISNKKNKEIFNGLINKINSDANKIVIDPFAGCKDSLRNIFDSKNELYLFMLTNESCLNDLNKIDKMNNIYKDYSLHRINSTEKLDVETRQQEHYSLYFDDISTYVRDFNNNSLILSEGIRSHTSFRIMAAEFNQRIYGMTFKQLSQLYKNEIDNLKRNELTTHELDKYVSKMYNSFENKGTYSYNQLRHEIHSLYYSIINENWYEKSCNGTQIGNSLVFNGKHQSMNYQIANNNAYNKRLAKINNISQIMCDILLNNYSVNDALELITSAMNKSKRINQTIIKDLFMSILTDHPEFELKAIKGNWDKNKDLIYQACLVELNKEIVREIDKEYSEKHNEHYSFKSRTFSSNDNLLTGYNPDEREISRIVTSCRYKILDYDKFKYKEKDYVNSMRLYIKRLIKDKYENRIIDYIKSRYIDISNGYNYDIFKAVRYSFVNVHGHKLKDYCKKIA